MNELINKTKEKEIINQVLDFLECDTPRIAISEFLQDEIKNINKNFKDIGLKDINGKIIYADSSIFEFKHKTLTDKVIGYFTNDIEYLRYEIKILKINPAIGNKSNFIFAKSLFSDIKIIDTIQENKFGLIK